MKREEIYEIDQSAFDELAGSRSQQEYEESVVRTVVKRLHSSTDGEVRLIIKIMKQAGLDFLYCLSPSLTKKQEDEKREMKQELKEYFKGEFVYHCKLLRIDPDEMLAHMLDR